MRVFPVERIKNHIFKSHNGIKNHIYISLIIMHNAYMPGERVVTHTLPRTETIHIGHIQYAEVFNRALHHDGKNHYLITHGIERYIS